MTTAPSTTPPGTPGDVSLFSSRADAQSCSLPRVGEGEKDPNQPPFSIYIGPQQQAGVWANFAQVSHSPYEFTLDFVRVDFSQQPPAGIVVSRVSLSPLLVSQLIDALSTNWQRYAERALPREVFDHGSGSDDEDER
jgi:Protein of unknown function (DUF3467)